MLGYLNGKNGYIVNEEIADETIKDFMLQVVDSIGQFGFWVDVNIDEETIEFVVDKIGSGIKHSRSSKYGVKLDVIKSADYPDFKRIASDVVTTMVDELRGWT